MNYAEYDDACAAIIRVLDEHPGGCKDEAALAAIRQRVLFLRERFGHLGYFAEKLLEVDEHAAILYSAHRHRQWDRGGTPGAQLQAGWVRRAANSFSDHLRQFERSGKEPPPREASDLYLGCKGPISVRQTSPCVDPLESSLVQVVVSAQTAIRAGMYLPALILIYAGIDTVGWLASTDPSERVSFRFCRWVERWALAARPLECTAVELYAARCGILHTFTADSDMSVSGKARRVCYAFGGSTAQQLQSGLDARGRSDCVAVHLDDLFDAFRLGLANYLEQAFADPAQKMQLARKAQRCFTVVAGDEAAQFYLHDPGGKS